MTFSTAEPLQEGIKSFPPLKELDWPSVMEKVANIQAFPDGHQPWEIEWAEEMQKEDQS